jgi:hypothetical protein
MTKSRNEGELRLNPRPAGRVARALPLVPALAPLNGAARRATSESLNNPVMKPFLLIPVLAVPLLLAACEATIVERHPRRVAYVENDEDYYYRPHHRSYRRDVVVVNPRPYYQPRVEVRYYNDTRGRYYIRDGRRIYVNAGVYY